MTTPLHLDDRRMRFDARRLALESFVKIHLEHVTGCRQLLLAHLRMIFTLSLGSLAGLVTLYASVMRFGSAASDQICTPTHILLAESPRSDSLVLAAPRATRSKDKVRYEAQHKKAA